MATGYTISVGYLNGSAFTGDLQEAWIELRTSAWTLAHTPSAICGEALRCGAPLVDDDDETITSYAERFQSDDCIMTLNDDQQCVFLMSSGANPMKGHVRRAFCRLLIAAMHRKGIEVNLIVA